MVKSFVIQLTLLNNSLGDIHGSNSPSSTIEFKNFLKKKKLENVLEIISIVNILYFFNIYIYRERERERERDVHRIDLPI